MHSILKILLAVVIFGILIFIHESGHFIAAKLCGIRVNKFAIGMGPRLIKKTRGETEYSLRLIPVGGFCAMEGEDSESDNDRAFNKKPVWQRIIVVAAGAFMNIVLGFILVIITTCMLTKIPEMKIADFHTENENSEKIVASSYETGLRENDEIIEIDGMHILTDSDFVYKLSSSDKETFDVVVKRNGQKIAIENVKFYNKETQSIIDFDIYGREKNPVSVLSYSFRETASTARLIWISVVDLISGKYGFRELSGPVGLVNAIGDAADAGENLKENVFSVLSLTIFITINLGIFNLLPIPGLDGGRLIFLFIEAVRRKPVKPEHEGAVHLIGMALLMLLIIAVTFGDIFRIIG
ncbi:MAG: M50 family metallopeptidase [Porcipelethomonas sp.]